jgi:hypothetical protein
VLRLADLAVHEFGEHWTERFRGHLHHGRTVTDQTLFVLAKRSDSNRIRASLCVSLLVAARW